MWLVVDEGQIANVAVAPAWRKQGIGRLLMERMIAKCIALGGVRLCLEVRLSNQPARRLYANLGFQEVGLRKKLLYPTPGGRHPDGPEPAPAGPGMTEGLQVAKKNRPAAGGGTKTDKRGTYDGTTIPSDTDSRD